MSTKQLQWQMIYDSTQCEPSLFTCVHFHSLPLVLAVVRLGGSGSAEVNSGRARLEKVLRSCSMGLSSTSLYSSTQIAAT